MLLKTLSISRSFFTFFFRGQGMTRGRFGVGGACAPFAPPPPLESGTVKYQEIR